MNKLNQNLVIPLMYRLFNSYKIFFRITLLSVLQLIVTNYVNYESSICKEVNLLINQFLVSAQRYYNFLSKHFSCFYSYR
jgi:hypothetical protein